jgi:hypothetical protein
MQQQHEQQILLQAFRQLDPELRALVILFVKGQATKQAAARPRLKLVSGGR